VINEGLSEINAEHACTPDLGRVLATWFGDGDPGHTPWKITNGKGHPFLPARKPRWLVSSPELEPSHCVG